MVPEVGAGTAKPLARALKFSFFDNRCYEYVRGFRRKLGKAVKDPANPVMVPDQPHEFKRLHYYGSALYDERDRRYLTWYSSHFYGTAFGEADPQAFSYLSLATSEDGVTFSKPDLGVVPGTNIVLDNDQRTHGPSVILDDADPDPSRRFKLAMAPYTEDCRIHLFASPDGIRWRPLFDGPVLDVPSDCHTGFHRDPASGRYQLTFRARFTDRRVWTAESVDLLNWSRPVMILEPDQRDSCETQFYGMQMTPYGAYTIGLVSVYETFDMSVDPTVGKMAGAMDVELAYSRDGFCWHRANQGRKLVRLGRAGEWDSGCITPSSTVIYRPDSMEIYYSGIQVDHSGYRRLSHEEIPAECIGVARLRPDGFVYLKAGDEVCEVLTRPFAVSDGSLHLNADAVGGRIDVEVCDVEGNPLPGFSYADSIPFSGDSIAHPVTWRGAPDPRGIERREIRLRLRARRAAVHSLTFDHGDPIGDYWRFREIANLPPLRYDLID